VCRAVWSIERGTSSRLVYRIVGSDQPFDQPKLEAEELVSSPERGCNFSVFRSKPELFTDCGIARFRQDVTKRVR